MNRFKSIISRTGIYTVSLCLFLYVFALLISFSNATIDIGGFLVILALSFVLSAAQEVFTVKSLATPYKFLIHYCATLLSFVVIYVTRNTTTATKVFIAIILFTIAYALICGIVYLIKRSINKAMGKN